MDYGYDTIICNPDLIQTQAIFKKWKKKPSKILATDNLELICHLTSQGIGYGVIPEKAVFISNLKLRKISSLPRYEDAISVVHRPEFGKSLAEKLLIEALRKTLNECH